MNRVDLKQICKDYGISVNTFTAAETTDGVAFPNKASGGLSTMIGDKPLILFDDTRPRFERRYIVAHELGHILLGHLTLRNKNGQLPEWAEGEANAFAAVLVANDILCRYGSEVAAPETTLCPVLGSM